MKSFILSCFLLFQLHGVFGSEIFQSAYSTETLNKFWHYFNNSSSEFDRVLQSLKEVEHFSIEEEATPSFLCNKDDFYCFLDDSNSDERIVIPENNEKDTKGVNVKVKLFSIHPLSVEYESDLKKRMAYLEIYLSRHASHQSTSKDSEETLKLNEYRKNSAYLELFMIHLRNYFSFSDLVQKCEQITKANKISEIFLMQGQEMAFKNSQILPQYKELYRSFQGLMNSPEFFKKFRKKSICNVTAQKDYNTIKAGITSHVHEKIQEYIQKLLRTYTQLFNEPQKEIKKFVNLVDDKNNDLKIYEIFSLEEKLNNVSANLSLLENDDFNLQRTSKTSLIDQLRSAKEELLDMMSNKGSFKSPEVTKSIKLASDLTNKYISVLDELKALGDRYAISSCQKNMDVPLCMKKLKEKIDGLKNKDSAESSFREKFSNAMLALTDKIKQGV